MAFITAPTRAHQFDIVREIPHGGPRFGEFGQLTFPIGRGPPDKTFFKPGGPPGGLFNPPGFGGLPPGLGTVPPGHIIGPPGTKAALFHEEAGVGTGVVIGGLAGLTIGIVATLLFTRK